MRNKENNCECIVKGNYKRVSDLNHRLKGYTRKQGRFKGKKRTYSFVHREKGKNLFECIKEFKIF